MVKHDSPDKSPLFVPVCHRYDLLESKVKIPNASKTSSTDYSENQSDIVDKNGLRQVKIDTYCALHVAKGSKSKLGHISAEHISAIVNAKTSNEAHEISKTVFNNPGKYNL